MKNSVEKARINHRDLEKLDWEYDRPQKEKIRRRKKRYIDDDMNTKDKNGKRRKKS